MHRILFAVINFVLLHFQTLFNNISPKSHTMFCNTRQEKCQKTELNCRMFLMSSKDLKNLHAIIYHLLLLPFTC